MWRVVLGGFINVVMVVAVSWYSYTSVREVQAEPIARTSTISSFATNPDQPDPNAIFEQINKIRASQGLLPLARNDKLANIAQKRAADMSAADYYAHRSPSGNYFYDMFGEQHYLAGFACENLDLEFNKLSDSYVNAWLGSKTGHRECLLNPLITEAGYATAQIKTSTETNADVPSYVVVAIYAEPK
jgi:uncharacterized protein YkwD